MRGWLALALSLLPIGCETQPDTAGLSPRSGIVDDGTGPTDVMVSPPFREPPTADSAGEPSTEGLTFKIDADVDAPDVFLIVIDTLRVDVTSLFPGDRDATPFLAELAKKSVLYRRAFSTSSWTVPAMYSLMTGLYPSQHGMTSGSAWGRQISEQPILSGRAYTLAEQMRDMGYGTFAVCSNQHLSAKYGMSQGFGRFVGEAFSKMPFPELALEALSSDMSASGRRFVWLHYFDPHHPYGAVHPWFDEWNDSGFDDYTALANDAVSRYFRRRHHIDGDAPLPLDAFVPIYNRSVAMRGSLPANFFADYEGDAAPPEGTPERRYLQFLRAAYASEVRSVDESIRRVFERLRIDDGDLVIVVADHGEELMEHGRIGHRFLGSMSQSLVHVPMLIRFPGNEGGGTAVDAPVSLIDIVPTIRGVLGQAPLAGLPGLDLSAPRSDPGAGRRRVFGELSEPDDELRFVVEYPWKLVRDERDGGTSLYHLGRDPGERADVAASNPAVVRALSQALAEWKTADVPAWPQGRTARLSGEEVQRLRAMGYLE